MNESRNHIIHQLNFELNANAVKDLGVLKDKSMSLLKEQILPTIEKIFDSYGIDEIIRIEHLELDLNVLHSGNMEAAIMEQLQKQLPSKIQSILKEENAQKIKKSIEKTFEYFLKNGILPWWDDRQTIQGLERNILAQLRSESKVLMEILHSLNPRALDRLIFQFKDTFFIELLVHENIENDFTLILGPIKRILSKYFSPRLVRNQIWKATIVSLYIDKNPKDVLIKKVVKHLVQNLSTTNKTSSPENILELIKKENTLSNKGLTKKQVNDLIEDRRLRYKSEEIKFSNNNISTDRQITTPIAQEYYIDNGGLIILHPFFVYLFEHLEYTKDNTFIDVFQQQQAALLLQYLVKGTFEHAEFELLLNKIICGIDINQPIENTLILNEEIKKQSSALLTSTIKHWAAIKNTSPEGLQNTFLQRAGKLTRNNNGDWKLFIQNKTEDILISKLPWSISMIKLPWMKNMLWVEWT